MMGELTLKTIMQAFINAENDFPAHLQKKIFSNSFASNSNKRCKAIKLTGEAFFCYWVPKSFISCLGSSDNGLTYDQICHLIVGRKKKVRGTLKSQFENNSVQMFWDYKDHLEKAIEWHIKVYVGVKYRDRSVFDREDVRLTENELTEEIKTKAEEYENTLKSFKKEMLKLILISSDSLSDERITKSKFYEILTDEKRDEVERLTILSIFGLFAAATVENEEYYINRIFKKLYDEKTNKLKPRPKTKEDQIKIDREAIWKASKNWYEQTKKEGNRFSKLFPDTRLLPLAGTIPIYVHSTDKQEKPLMDTIQETAGHLYLIGEGGIGKTTALYSIMEDAYANCEEQINQQVPLYIELSRAYKTKDFELDRGESKYIRHTVQNQLQISLNTKEDLETRIEEEFKKDTNEPKYVLLLDGLNEVSREEIKGHVILRMVVAEITYIMANYKNVRVILTSRSEEKLSGESKSLYLSGIDSKQIEAYLIKKKVSSVRIKQTVNNTQLMEILRIPLFLIMYSVLKGEDEILSRGEILHAFFSKTNKERYTEKNRIKTINSEFAKETGIDRSEGSKDCITPHMLNFILEFIMPQIAWNMVKENEFQIKRAGIKKAVKQVLTDKTETSFISEYGLDFFNEYLTGEDENIRTTAERIMKVFGVDGTGGMDSISSGVLKCLTKQFGLLVTNDYKEYEVLHQHIRDYFAALYHINKLKLAAYINEQGDRDKAIECLSELAKEPLPGQILVFIGEALGELHNVPKLNEEKNEWIKKEPERGTERDLINRNFDIFRGNINENYAVWNLFQILKLVREDLSGTDLSGLDLRRCRANGYRLGNQTFAVKLDNAIVSDEFFLLSGPITVLISAVFSPDGKYILTAYDDGTAKVWDAKTFTEVLGSVLVGHNEGIISALYSPDGKYILMVCSDGTVKIWDAKTFKESPGGTLEVCDRELKSAIYSPDGKYILTKTDFMALSVWDAKTYKEISGEALNGYNASAVAYSPDGENILMVCSDGTVKILDAKTFKIILGGTLEDPSVLVESIVYSPDRKNILIVCLDGDIEVLDAETFKKIPGGTLEDAGVLVVSGVYSPDGKYILTAAIEGTVKLWDTMTYKEIPGGTLEVCNRGLQSAIYSSDGKYILMVSDLGTVEVWDATTFKKVPDCTLNVHDGLLSSFVYSPDGKYILILSWNGKVTLWDAKTFKEIPGKTFEIHDETASIVYSPDGKIFLTVCAGAIDVWDAKTYKKIHGKTFEDYDEILASVTYSPDGKYILTVSFDGIVNLWDAKTYKEISVRKLKGHSGCIESAIYSPDGKNILIKYLDGTIELWDAKTYKEISGGALNGYTALSVAYSPDGENILIASDDGTVKLWDTKTFTEVSDGMLVGHNRKLLSAVYSPDGKNILTASDDGTVKVWDAKTFKEIQTIDYVLGLRVFNVDICKLNKTSNITDDIKKILHEYGAIVE